MSISVAVVAGVAGVGAYSLYLRRDANSDQGTFASFGFTSLRLHSTELMNHIMRRLRFELPDPNAKTGLALTSATLTISFPNGSWIPVLRPYTPVSELG